MVGQKWTGGGNVLLGIGGVRVFDILALTDPFAMFYSTNQDH